MQFKLGDFHIERHEAKLNSGARVVLFKKDAAPVCTAAILLSGSKYDPENAPGTAHFIEHMITNGSERFPTKDLLAEHIESVGGMFGARTNQDYQIVDTEVSDKSDYGRVVDIFEATLCKPLMDRKVFENEKKVVIKEIDKCNSSPQRLLIKATRNNLFKDTAFEHDVLGTEQSINALVYEEVVKEHKKLFDATRITFVASGDISIDELTAHLNQLPLLQGESFVLDNSEYISDNDKKVAASFLDVNQTHLYFAVPSPKKFTQDLLHLNLLGAIIAGGRTARLTKRLRYEAGLVYTVGYNQYGGTNIGTWGIITDTTNSNVQIVIDTLIREIKDILKNGILESELEFVKNRRTKSIKRTMQTSADWVDFHAAGEASSEGKYHGIEEFLDETMKTTVEDIARVADVYLQPEKWKLIMVGKTMDSEICLNWE